MIRERVLAGQARPRATGLRSPDRSSGQRCKLGSRARSAPPGGRDVYHSRPLCRDVHPLVVVQTLEVEPIRGLEVALDHAASTAFQISGAVLYLTRSLSSLN